MDNIVKERIKTENVKCFGGSLQSQIDITYDELVEILGEPNAETDGYKTDAEWNFEFDGVPFSIYNYKDGVNYLGLADGLPVEFITDWHIGGENKQKAEELRDFLLEHRSGETPVKEVMEEDYEEVFEAIKKMGRIEFEMLKRYLSQSNFIHLE